MIMETCHRTVWLGVILLVGLANQRRIADAQSTFANITLKANNGDLSVVIYLPQGIKPDEPTYYLSTRFEHGSMIGNIKRTVRNPLTGESATHVLYGTDQWRVPHDPYWPESGVGLASEFGVGDDGPFCNYRCGWHQVNDVTNGILGYTDAKNGESFLKIGVGELIKGSCSTCDSTEDFKFNSPYKFAKPSVWKLEQHPETNSIALEHEATLNLNGYKLRKEIQLNNDQLSVKSILTNTGRVSFATAWYSHHFFTCDSHPVGAGIGVDLDVIGTQGKYDEPAAWFWSTPLQEFATVTPRPDVVSVDMERGVDRNVRIKAEFSKDDQSHGTFTLRGCDTSITEIIPEVGMDGGVSMYAYNLYIESSTFSPEPQIYMSLLPGQTISWTQKLTFKDLVPAVTSSNLATTKLKAAIATPDDEISRNLDRAFLLFAMTAAFFAFCIQSVWRTSRVSQYSRIPDHNAVP